jgi:hypothetical protein
MCRVNSQKTNYKQHSLDTGNYIIDKQITDKQWWKKICNYYYLFKLQMGFYPVAVVQ